MTVFTDNNISWCIVSWITVYGHICVTNMDAHYTEWLCMLWIYSILEFSITETKRLKPNMFQHDIAPVHKAIVCEYIVCQSCNKTTQKSCTEPWPQPHRPLLGWIKMPERHYVWCLVRKYPKCPNTFGHKVYKWIKCTLPCALGLLG